MSKRFSRHTVDDGDDDVEEWEALSDGTFRRVYTPGDLALSQIKRFKAAVAVDEISKPASAIGEAEAGKEAQRGEGGLDQLRQLYDEEGAADDGDEYYDGEEDYVDDEDDYCQANSSGQAMHGGATAATSGEGEGVGAGQEQSRPGAVGATTCGVSERGGPWRR